MFSRLGLFRDREMEKDPQGKEILTSLEMPYILQILSSADFKKDITEQRRLSHYSCDSFLLQQSCFKWVLLQRNGLKYQSSFLPHSGLPQNKTVWNVS